MGRGAPSGQAQPAGHLRGLCPSGGPGDLVCVGQQSPLTPPPGSLGGQHSHIWDATPRSPECHRLPTQQSARAQLLTIASPGVSASPAPAHRGPTSWVRWAGGWHPRKDMDIPNSLAAEATLLRKQGFCRHDRAKMRQPWSRALVQRPCPLQQENRTLRPGGGQVTHRGRGWGRRLTSPGRLGPPEAGRHRKSPPSEPRKEPIPPGP